MKDERKTKRQLISELNALRRRLDGPPSTAAESGTTTAAGEPPGDRFEILFNHDQDALVVIDANPAAGKKRICTSGMTRFRST